MDTTLPSKLLEVQHHQIDQGIEGIVDSTGEPLALAAALALLREHVYLEEAILFPPLAKTGLTMPVSVMQREHGEIWPMIRSLEVACAAGATATREHGRCPSGCPSRRWWKPSATRTASVSKSSST